MTMMNANDRLLVSECQTAAKATNTNHDTQTEGTPMHHQTMEVDAPTRIRLAQDKAATAEDTARKDSFWQRFLAAGQEYAEIVRFSYAPALRPQSFACWVRIAGETALADATRGSRQAETIHTAIRCLERHDALTARIRARQTTPTAGDQCGI